MSKIVICGAGGFIGTNLANKLVNEDHYVVGIDLKYPEFGDSPCDKFIIGDLRSYGKWLNEFDNVDEVYQLAADMGGALHVFTKEHDADIMHNSAQINLNIAELCVNKRVGKVFYSSSACIYPEYKQLDSNHTGLKESDDLPLQPDSLYGIEKYFSEQLYDAYRRNKGLNVRIARFHNIFGEMGTIEPLRSKAPAAVTKKVIESDKEIEILGSGLQSRSFLYIDECLKGIELLMESDYYKPINIGSSESISINDLAKMVIEISGKDLKIKNILDSNAIGVMGRNSDNTLCQQVLGWSPNRPLREGMEKLYKWVDSQINSSNP